MGARLRAGRIAVPFGLPAKAPTWSYLDRGAQAGVLLRGVAPMNLRGTHVGRGDVRVELGDHPKAERMAALGMARRPLPTLHARGLTGDGDAFEAAG